MSEDRRQPLALPPDPAAYDSERNAAARRRGLATPYIPGGRDPEQARWYARICENFDGTRVCVVGTPWDQALANRVPLDLGAVAEPTLDAKLAMAEVVLRGVDRANRRRLGLPEDESKAGYGQRGLVPPPRWPSGPIPPRWPSGPMPPVAPDGAQETAAGAEPVRPISWHNGAGELGPGRRPSA